ncbi:hypothetical protein ABWH92_12645 [Ahrensia marina]|uniref:hypothetical protein n=1 Tax=Ahrensia marina TaxID=1514904 RepID=UPI0035D0F7DB
MQEPHHLSVGDISFLYEPGLVRRLMVAGTEVIRMISAPVRDANWGTFSPKLLSNSIDETPDNVRIEEVFSVADGRLLADLTFVVHADGVVSANLIFTGKEDVQTNRAGFTLLHPIAGTTGNALTVSHSDGCVTQTQFPEQIAPGQPAIEICGLAHKVGDVDVRISFKGETFETEDQRNWSDASFKTYCRPLSLPFPYTIVKGETVTQRIEVNLDRKFESTHRGVAARPTQSIQKPVRLPQICLAVEPDWLTSASLPRGVVPVLRFTGGDSYSDEKLAQIVQTHQDVDVEIIVPEDKDALGVCETVKDCLERCGLNAKHITALPQAYLKSYQPTGPWPEGLSPESCTQVALQTFTNARIGVGMLTHFTEFNRRAPDTSFGDYVTFANAAIVHAADDISVWETLETLPYIFASAKALSGDLPIRLGLVSIGMRSNPYGAALVPNLCHAKIAMTGDDPRQTAPFAAAYAVAAFALAAQAGVEAIALAAPSGRLGMMNADGSLLPIGKALKALSALGPEANLMVSQDKVTLSNSIGSLSADICGQGALHLSGFGEDND